MHILRLARLLQWERLALTILALAVTPAAPAASGTPETQRAEQDLREYFEFTRCPLEKSVLDKLSVPSYALEATPEHPALIFTTTPGNAEVCNSYPVVLVSPGDGWWIVSPPGEPTGWSWSKVYTSPDRAQLWATLTFYCESPGHEVLLLHSSDGGWTWHTLSQLPLGNYETFSMAPDGKGTAIGGWHRDGEGWPCPIDTAATSDVSHDTCRGLTFFKSEDWGATWAAIDGFHGSAHRLQDRVELWTEPLASHPYLSLDELRDRFDPISGPTDPDRLPGAETLPFDQELLEKAALLSRYGGFLEIPGGKTGDIPCPYLLDRGDSRGTEKARLIRLPYPDYQWQTLGQGAIAGILQPTSETAGETWIVQRLNENREWTIGKLPSLPRKPYVFDCLYDMGPKGLELHVRRLPNADQPDEPGREIYRSADSGRTWELARFDPDILVPVTTPQYPQVKTREEADQLLPQVMTESIAELVTTNRQRPAQPQSKPAVEELAGLLKTLDWRMPTMWGSPSTGHLALHFAITYEGDSVALLKALLDAGADIHARTRDGDTALDCAVRENARDAIAFLRARETNWGGANERGRTSLHWLADISFHRNIDWGWKGDADDITRRIVEHAEFLLDHGADVNAEDEGGNTPLEIAREHNPSSGLTRLLEEHGAQAGAAPN